ncbi:LLM class flavin-dependent oxidoreductase [Pelagibacterium halotolerans]|uniref:Alkanal monooxygenase alpha chain n=1 Tax=Pelagibacterium halotolerans (strain DSM 22347 / JCM 15775 / CGMCC 1.7692 / B2) TaxID=1082931 RepID=G4RGF2_PELHB|nr:LLM class flavin-dependent oxidoreductase [Pelagibacterium halotolerans]AEQ50128.1 alkanal monooxygenase alpha chain [Pelagibacterium halotolerans B2]QJR19858.1 LLM class flavin-dependent oxidoreductase [Pelagibacterium halotolerans]SEA48630.1 Flavin-dependent oxidoreductase, luciferase family (includes alkanesulfonate monooxygenase SsuD and methylene tetrahydromethanopterin reductase) [Pelagibacterium halotolerans]
MRIDIAGFTRGTRALDHHAVLDFCSRMDALGYNGIWFNEFHFQQPPDPYPSTLLLAASIFARTRRIRVGTSIVVLPLYHPLLLAEQIAQLHWQSGGRFDLGIGRGTHPSTLAVLGIPPESTRDRFEQSFVLMKSAWHRPTLVSEGSAWPSSSAPVGPLLPDGERIPVYAAGSTAETIEFAVSRDLPLLLSLEPPEQRQLSVYDEIAGNRSGRYPADFSISRYVTIAPTRAEALATVDAVLPRLYERRKRYAIAQNRPLDTIKPIDRDFFLSRQMVAGSPEDCVEQLTSLRDQTGIESVRLIFNCNGEVPEPQADAMATLFGQEALGALQSLSPSTPSTEVH